MTTNIPKAGLTLSFFQELSFLSLFSMKQRALWKDFITECDKNVSKMIFNIRLGSPLILLWFFPFLMFIPFCIIALICFITKRKVGTVTIASGFLTVWAFFFFAITLSWPRGVGSWPWDFYQVITVVMYAVITVLGFRRLHK